MSGQWHTPKGVLIYQKTQFKSWVFIFAKFLNYGIVFPCRSKTVGPEKDNPHSGPTEVEMLTLVSTQAFV